jgi:hypothetical protein
LVQISVKLTCQNKRGNHVYVSRCINMYNARNGVMQLEQYCMFYDVIALEFIGRDTGHVCFTLLKYSPEYSRVFF